MIDPAYHQHLLALADDELCMGHRHSEWLGVAPFLEEDLAFASIGQDELGHARALYGLMSDDIDGLAFGRTAAEFRSCHLAELPCSTWEEALVRHFLYDMAETFRWEALLASPDSGLVGVAERALREERYHVGHAEPMVLRMLSGTEESRRRVTGAVEAMYPIARSIFEPVSAEGGLVASGDVALSSAEIERMWVDRIAESLGQAGVVLDRSAPAEGLGGRCGERSGYFAGLWETMTAVTAIDPAATW